jgi:hypothetical protein
MEAGMLPRMDNEDSQRFTPTEVLLYQHAHDHSWTVGELRALIALLKRLEFKPADIDDDLHQRISKAFYDKMIQSFNISEGSLDGDQDLTMFMREVEDIVRNIMEDSRLKGHQHYRCEMELDPDHRRETLVGWGGQRWRCFQIGQLRLGDGTVPLAIVIYIDGSFIKNKIAVKPIYITLRNLDSAVSGMSMAWRLLGLLPSLK